MTNNNNGKEKEDNNMSINNKRPKEIEQGPATSIQSHIIPFWELLTKILSHTHNITLYLYEKMVTKMIEMNKIFELESLYKETQNILDKECNINTKVFDK